MNEGGVFNRSRPCLIVLIFVFSIGNTIYTLNKHIYHSSEPATPKMHLKLSTLALLTWLSTLATPSPIKEGTFDVLKYRAVRISPPSSPLPIQFSFLPQTNRLVGPPIPLPRPTSMRPRRIQHRHLSPAPIRPVRTQLHCP